MTDANGSLTHGEIRSFLIDTIEQYMHGDVDAVIDENAPVGAGGLGLESVHLLELCAHINTCYGVDLQMDLVEMSAMSFGALIEKVAHRANAISH